jgi:hypothetical protein
MTAAYRAVKRGEDTKLGYARMVARTMAQRLVYNGQHARADENKWLETMLQKYGIAPQHIPHAMRIVRQMVHAR